MKLQEVSIENYRSIESISFTLNPQEDGSFTYGLIGVNEAGKSSILKALALKDGLKNTKGEKLPLLKDFKDASKPIKVSYVFSLESEEVEAYIETLQGVLPEHADSIDLSKVVVSVYFDPANPQQPRYELEIPNLIEGIRDTVRDHIRQGVLEDMPEAIFWTAEDRYLISQPINIQQFANTPGDISIPLKNCFALAEMTAAQEIQRRVSLIGDSTEREKLRDDLGEKVTQHINNIWRNHPVTITFDISDGLINFHVHDSVRGRAKTADQRSDGFGQFVSFLLTISAQNRNEELSNSILLIDEPETHLHPQAQMDLLKELVKVTTNDRGNIAFFATHSNYLIDKEDLSRNYIVSKQANNRTGGEKTQVERFSKKDSTYASVTYEVFDIPTSDYHNELYSKLHENYQDQDPNDTERSRILNFDSNYFVGEKQQPANKPWKGNPNTVSLPTYIRNCIHHPDNGNTYPESDLRKSIDLMRSYLP